MSEPHRFSWVHQPLVAGMAEPYDLAEYVWLREQGIELVISLTEQSPRRDWINHAGLMLLHEPIPDMTAPNQEQIDNVLSAIANANDHNMGAAVHCTAGLGRTGTILACYLVEQGATASDAIASIRQLRPGSVETDEQIQAIEEFARRKGNI